ncbi:MAG: transcriptional repressor [Aliishimia sp.]
MDTIGFSKHDHTVCIEDCVATIEAHCAEAGLQFTPTRRRVLEILLDQHKALGAYDILEVLRSEGLGSQPPVAYRALDFLVANGFAHKIEHLNAFIACCRPGQTHTAAFLICRMCKAVAEAPSTPARIALEGSAEAVGFSIEATVVEATGLCPNCA